MDSSIENARLIDELEELSTDELLKNYAEACGESESNLIRHLIKERERKQQKKHEIKNSINRGR